MELDELKLAWQALDRRLDWQQTLTLHFLNERRLDRLAGGLRPLFWGQIVQIVAGVLLMVWAASFWVVHRDVTSLLVSGLLLHAYGLMFVVFAARTLCRICAIDFGAPVLDIQKRLAALRLWNIRGGQWFGAIGCFIWIPLLVIAFGGIAPGMLYWLIASGGVCLLLLLGLVSLPHWAPRLGRYMEASYVGRSVRHVQARLDEIARFERE
jgi:hypothetical protein